ncbi:putative toxin secretion atp-binding abc transporter protein [marine gamma proteobacterium HTCC2143]|uniref:Putative toxin secretion atp-binding abc transporter protein n=1 Tax=marine gamma proteobacterium HTCC2143 TaxID=247633 RepID=A0Y7Q8_9GAMM|nr:putative toxin secretion atp-binding abc transporter protein [marine gamma proteobacterium HTCC2143]
MEKVAHPTEVPLSWFTQTLWKFTPLYIELIFLAICLRTIGIIEPFIFQVIIDKILPFQREATLLVVIMIFAAASLFQIGFSILSSILGILTANRVTREFGSRIYDHLFKLPLRHFRNWTVGETIARIGETDTIKNFIVGTTTGVFLDLIFVFIYIAVLYTLSPTLTAIIVLALPFQAMVYFGFGPSLRKRLRVQFDTGASHQARMVENISGIEAIKALSAEKPMLTRLEETLTATLNASYRVSLLGMANRQIIFLINRSITISVIFVGAGLVFQSELTLGQLIAFHLMSGKVAGPISGFSKLWESWQNIRVSRQRLGDVVNSSKEPFSQLPQLPPDLAPRLTLDNISFAYNNNIVLRDFTATIPANKLTLIVGVSGAGKSTLGRIAAGIDVPTRGRILLGEENISHFEPHDVRSTINYVPQDPYLFSGTIRENLSVGKPGFREQDIYHALNTATANDLIRQLPGGIDTQVGERGTALSGGQRQRIAIARSILIKPKVLILDEPTSALDEKNQLLMIERLQLLTDSMTVVVITHRPDIFPANSPRITLESVQ